MLPVDMRHEIRRGKTAGWNTVGFAARYDVTHSPHPGSTRAHNVARVARCRTLCSNGQTSRRSSRNKDP